MKLPTHISLMIEHQPHACSYETVEEYLKNDCCGNSRRCDYSDEEKLEMIRTGNIWTIQWYPDTPNGFLGVAAATLERALEIANQYNSNEP